MYQESRKSTNGRKKGNGKSFAKSSGKRKPASKNPSKKGQSGASKKSQVVHVPFKSSDRTNSFSRHNSGKNRTSRSRRSNQKAIDHSRFINKTPSACKAEKYVPKHRFSDFALIGNLIRNVEARGYKSPTPIQDKVIPFALEGRDIIGVADTGTGKTAAFIVPLINKVLKNRNQKVLVITPTRELAVQIDTELRCFSKGMNIFSVQCIGGANIERQFARLRRNPQFVIGTPGRIYDLIKRGKLRLGNVQNIVLDEVDRMLDMGFINDISKILSFLPQNRQSMFFSATVSPKISNLIKTFSKDPVTVSIESTVTSDNIEQDIIRVKRKQDKIETLHNLLIQDDFRKVLIFGRTRRGVERLSKQLQERGFKNTSIHGDKSQSKREKALQLFKQNHLNILVATDVAARGLDIDTVTHVINYDLPENYDDYIHRIGRTGRANKQGVALTFVQ